MLGAMKTQTLIIGLFLATACGGSDAPSAGNSGPATPSGSGANSTPADSELPTPLMRQSVQCCADLKLEKAVSAYSELVAALAQDQSSPEGVNSLISELQTVTKNSDDFAPFVKALQGVDANDLATVRKEIGALSEVLLKRMEASASASGTYDLAFGYSRKADSVWAQVGVEPKSPYGDGIQSYSWGSREEILAIDLAREKQLGNMNLGATP
jgi:hypothetical protein